MELYERDLERTAEREGGGLLVDPDGEAPGRMHRRRTASHG